MTGPSTKTIKRLFALSGNQCAFPNCANRLIDEGSGKVTGEVCHIKGRRPGAKRHDPAQSVADCHSFENLLILCPLHHSVVDDDDVAYTVERLVRMKRDHEGSSKATSELTDQEAEKIRCTIKDISITEGSVIISNNQSGGQVAHSITNIVPVERTLSERHSDVVSVLKKGPKGDVALMMPFSADSEIQALESEIETCLTHSGWSISSRAVIPLSGKAEGVVIQVKSREAAPERARWLFHALSDVGLLECCVMINERCEHDDVGIIVARKPSEQRK